MKIIKGFIQELPDLVDYGWGTSMRVSALTGTHANKAACMIGPAMLVDGMWAGQVPYIAGAVVTTGGLITWNSRAVDKVIRYDLNGWDNIPLKDAIVAHPSDEYRISMGLINPNVMFLRVTSPSFGWVGDIAPLPFHPEGIEPPLSCRVGDLPVAHKDLLTAAGFTLSLPIGSEVNY